MTDLWSGGSGARPLLVCSAFELVGSGACLPFGAHELSGLHVSRVIVGKGIGGAEGTGEGGFQRFDDCVDRLCGSHDMSIDELGVYQMSAGGEAGSDMYIGFQESVWVLLSSLVMYVVYEPVQVVV
jgi:hypothetical protein